EGAREIRGETNPRAAGSSKTSRAPRRSTVTLLGIRFGASTWTVATTTLFASFVSAYRSAGSTTALTRTSAGSEAGLGVHVALAAKPETVRSGRTREIVATPNPVPNRYVTSTRTPWLPTSVFAGVRSLTAGADTVSRKAPVVSVEPVAVKLIAGMMSRIAALAAVVFARTSNGPPG